MIFFSVVCATLAFDFNKEKSSERKIPKNIIYTFCLHNSKNSDEPSILLWNWILKYIRLTPKNAALHNIYQNETAAFFFDLDDDGVNEILGTHHSTTISGRGDSLLYIIKYDKNKSSKYKPISKNLYFDADSHIDILEEKSNGYHKIQVSSTHTDKPKILSFDKKKEVYTEK